MKTREHIRRWAVIWIVSIIAVSALFGVNETLLRKAGHLLSVGNDCDLWSQQRERVSRADATAWVLLGASRMQINFDCDYLKKQHPESEVIQLAINGRGTSYDILCDIADNTDFRGTVVVSETEATLTKTTSNQSAHVVYYQKVFSLDRSLNRSIASFIQMRVLFPNPTSSSQRLWGNVLFKHRLPPPFYVQTLPDRQQISHFALFECDPLRRQRHRNAARLARRGKADAAQWLETVTSRWYAPVDKLKKRGAEVVFVRMPVDSVRTQFEQTVWPVQDFWAPLMDTLGVPGIHCAEYPEFFELRYPDASHVDAPDRQRFTAMLLAIIERRRQARNPQHSQTLGRFRTFGAR